MSARRGDVRRTTASGPGRTIGRWVLRIALVLVVIAGLAITAFAIAVARTSVPTPNEVAQSEATIVYWADGVTELGRLGDATRRSVELSDIPLPVQQAVLAAEDRAFYEHGGVSPGGLFRALVNNVRGGSIQGGSTITQQYAKNAYLTQERSWERKAKELLLAFKLETVVSKESILNDYLNTIYFGRGAYGVEAAAIAYFGKPVADLNVEQGAVLASIIKSPNGLAPEKNPRALQERWGAVLDAMVAQGWLSSTERQSARFPEIMPMKASNRLGGQTGYLLNAVTNELVELGFDETEIQRGGLRITSTFERSAQTAAQQAVRREGPKSLTQGLRIGLAAIRPGTGEVVAMYGGRDFITDQINNATQPFAQAGSTFKPFALAAATEEGITLKSVWNGASPSTIDGYTLTNYGDKSYSDVTLLKATELSINTAYVNLEAAIGVPAVADAALRAGIPTSTPGLGLGNLNLTFVLGTASPSGLDVANAYATFAAQGLRATPTFIHQVKGPNGGLLYAHTPRLAKAFTPDVANTVTYALTKVVRNGTAFAARAIDRPAAAKTGTTDDNKSAWFAGFTPDLAAAVLMAKEDETGLPVSLSGTGGLRTVTGGSFPAAIWSAFMKAALAGSPVREFPAPPSGALAAPDCPTVVGAIGETPPPGCPSASAVEFEPSSSAVPGPVSSASSSAGPEPSDGPGFVPPDQPTPPAPPAPTGAAPQPGNQ